MNRKLLVMLAFGHFVSLDLLFSLKKKITIVVKRKVEEYRFVSSYESELKQRERNSALAVHHWLDVFDLAIKTQTNTPISQLKCYLDRYDSF